jgi:hypothetical protein
MSLPKFEDYTHDAKSANLESFEKMDEHNFSWQEKIFSLWELKRYSDIHNCTNDTELSYHKILNDTDQQASKIFTYIHGDYHLPLPVDNFEHENGIIDLSSCIDSLNLNEKIGRLVSETTSMGHLFKSEENLDMAQDRWRAMHIIFDNSEYNV